MLDCSAAEAAVAMLQEIADGRRRPPEIAGRWAGLIASPAYAAWAAGCGWPVAPLRRGPPTVGGTTAGALAAFAEGPRRDRLRSRLARARLIRADEAAARAAARHARRGPVGPPPGLHAALDRVEEAYRRIAENPRARLDRHRRPEPAAGADRIGRQVLDA